MDRYVLLDRDGTLVPDVGYPHRPEDCVLLPGVVEALRRLAAAGYGLAIVTNQSGIGRGLFGEADFERFQRRLLDDLAAGGVTIAGSFHCPHAPDAGCSCRKPAPGLLWQARDALGIDLARSWLIGDSPRDVEAARRAGCRGLRIDPAAGSEPKADPPHAPDLAAAVELLLGLDAG